MEKNLVVAS